MRRIVLFLLKYYLKKSNRKFRLNVCKEIHNYYQNDFCEQTIYGRYYWAVGDMIESGPESILLCNYFNIKGGICKEFEERKNYIKNKPRRKKLQRILSKS